MNDVSPVTLYRFYDAAGALLYVGITVDLPGRIRRHRHEAPWWSTVARIDIEYPTDPATASQLERQAIRAEQPKHNRLVALSPPDRPWQPDPSRGGPSDIVTDIRSVFLPDEPGLWAEVIVRRLALSWPLPYRRWTVRDLGFALRSAGRYLTPLHRKVDGHAITRRGIRLTDLED